LVPLEAAMFLADRDEDYILSAVDCGAIPWAWDIRSSEAERREVRLERASFVRWLGLPEDKRQAPANDARSEAAVMGVVLPRPGDLRATELKRMFTCGHQHVLNLLSAGLLRAALGSVVKTGPNGSPRITSSSIVHFLQTRRIV
jgi:hypothetical protein